VEEAALTGESHPVEKIVNRENRKEESHISKNVSASANSRKTVLPDKQFDKAYMSTIVLSGRGMGVVTAVGMETEIGKIATMIDDEKEEPTPLQKHLGKLGTILSILSLVLCGVLFVIAIWQKRNISQMLVTAISLAVAAVPEGLPAVVTICLALSLTRMAKQNTIVRRLPGVETLGSVSIVCSDKTGTLTQNSMTVEKGYWNNEFHEISSDVLSAGTSETKVLFDRRLPDQKDKPPMELLYGLILCNDASLDDNRAVGDPTEIALLRFGRLFDLEKEKLERENPRIDEIPFDSASRKMTTFHDGKRGRTGYRKGAPDVILKDCDRMIQNGSIKTMTEHDRGRIGSAVDVLSAQAYRTLALASLHDGIWCFIGIVGMRDPVRKEALPAVRLLRDAGVRTVMITGDHKNTAMAVGKLLGICSSEDECMTGEELEGYDDNELKEACTGISVYARVSPFQKVRIVKALQSRGERVAMTGDGVNDAPSLRAADIGIAMGKNGTDVAKQAADMILTDDHFATIEKAMEEGRGVYENIRKSIIFLLSSNLGELLTMFVTILAMFPAPLRSSHILWINLITDSLPALALGVSPNDTQSLMKNSPRKEDEGLFSRGGLACTCFYGGLIACISLVAFLLPAGLLANGFGNPGITIAKMMHTLEQPQILMKAQTYAFTVLGMSQLFHAIGMRDVGKSVFAMGRCRNPVMLIAVATGILLQIAVTEIPMLIEMFGTVALSLTEWLNLLGLSVMPLVMHEVFVMISAIIDRASVLEKAK